MSEEKLTKQKAAELITPIVDNEVDEKVRAMFLAYIETDEEIRKEYESVKRLKKLIATRCPRAKAPDRLKKNITAFIASTSQSSSFNHPEGYQLDIPTDDASLGSEPSSDYAVANGPSFKWMYAVAATVLIAVAFWGIIYINQAAPVTYNVEEYAYQHFTDHKGAFIQPTIQTASLTGAEVKLASSFDYPITVPPLENAEFKGVVFTDFVPGFEAPLLEYYLPSDNQYVYIFAFRIDALDKFEKLSRDQQAISACIQPEDFHIRNINGKYVVSWKWDGIWYAAISNHDGKTLASLVEPLGYNPNK